MELIFLVSIFLPWVICKSFPSRNLGLHNLMNAEELKFYFGTEIDLPDYEVVYLPENLPSIRESVVADDTDYIESEEKYLTFEVFDKNIKLYLQPNRNLISPHATVVVKSANRTIETFNPTDGTNKSCHFLHKDSSISASISNCNSNEIRGLIFLPDDSLEISPLSSKLRFLLKLRLSSKKITQNGLAVEKIPHLVKKSNFIDSGGFENDFLDLNLRSRTFKKRNATNSRPVVELGLFFDEAFYKSFSFFFDHNELINFILAYINGVQALFFHNSLKRQIDLAIVHLELMQVQPKDMPHAYGERDELIENFCRYQKSINSKNDHQKNHYDLAAYISALDFFAWGANGIKNGATMGLATVGGVCNDDYNCIIVEFGSINQFGRPYPSSGFTSVYILAHEIGHSLGMGHDSIGNSCSKDGFIMSPSRGSQGETTWSNCSANVAQNLGWAECLFDKIIAQPAPGTDHWIYEGYPGVNYSAKEQCEIYLRDKEAFAFFDDQIDTICDNLNCKTSNRPGYFFAGPALQGTECGYGKWCDVGNCVNKMPLTTTTRKPTTPNWGPWKYGSCKSLCISFSKGVQIKERACSESDDLCFGLSSSVELCDDRQICKKRELVIDYGTRKCNEFSRNIYEIDPTGQGLQASYDRSRLWMPCAIFCKRKNTTSYYTPRVELHKLRIDPYFPDGTICHQDETENFYCIHHHCLPESTKFSKILSDSSENDEELMPTSLISQL